MTVRDPLDAVPGLEHPGVQLMLSVLFDFIGMVTYMIPFLGEFGDLLWAPIQAMFIAAMVGGERYGWFLVCLGFAEEILPLTDFIPTCTIAWVWKYVRR